MRRISLFVLCMVSLVLSSCGPGQLFGPTHTPTPTTTFTPTVTFTPTITQTASPTPTATIIAAAQTLAPVSQVMAPVTGSPLLVEQFPDNSRGWAGFYPGSEVSIQNSKLYLKNSQADRPALAYCAGNCGPYQFSYYYQAELIEEASSNFGIGLVFGMNPEKGDYYNFLVRPSTGQFSLQKYINNALTLLLDWTASTAINQFPQQNTIGVSFQAGSMDLYINGEKVANFVDQSPYIAGRIGFYLEQGGIGLLASNAAVFSQEVTATTPSPLPSPAQRITATPTPVGMCPPNIPQNTFILMVTKISPGKDSIYINGVKKVITTGVNPFYLKLGPIHVVEIGGESAQYRFTECRYVYVKVQ